MRKHRRFCGRSLRYFVPNYPPDARHSVSVPPALRKPGSCCSPPMTLSVAGQVIGDGFENAEICLFSDGNEYKVTTGELADFEIQKVVRGTYRMLVTGRELEVVIESIDLN